MEQGNMQHTAWPQSDHLCNKLGHIDHMMTGMLLCNSIRYAAIQVGIYESIFMGRFAPMSVVCIIVMPY